MSTYNASLTLIAPTQTVSSSTTPSSGTGPIDQINILSVALTGTNTLTVDGLDATVSVPLAVTALGSFHLNAVNGADLTLDYGLATITAVGGTTFGISDTSSITVEPGLIDLSLLGPKTVDFSASTGGSFNWEGTASTSFSVVGFGDQDSLNVGDGTFSSFINNGGGSAALSYSTGTGVVTFNITGMDPALAAQIAADPSAFIDPATGALILCFMAGTMVAVPGGERAVEDLAIGDLVQTATGDTRPVRWIGRRVTHRAFGDPLMTHPIRITAGALGDNLPVRDLYVSPDHALMIDGLLVQAGALVNGTTIVRHRPDELRFTYYHIELEDHALVLVEGVAAETFVDNVARSHFDNYAEFEALYGAEQPASAEIDLPRVKSARQLPQSLRAKLDRQVAALGFTAAA